eukprot:UN10645
MEIDFKIFKTDTTKCNIDDNEDEIVKNCDHLLRIAYCLRYYQLLCQKESDLNAQQILIEFCSDSYLMCLSDYIHLMTKHSETETLNKISYDLQKCHNMEICANMNDCKWTKRHYRNREDEKNNNNHFYLNIFDTIHFYIFHLESLGLRVIINENLNEN